MKKVCILIPVYNEEQVLPLLEKRLLAVCNPLPYRFRFLMVNDGSTDQSLSILKHMRKRDPRFCYLSLSRNFGKEAAVLAGMDYFHEDALILMDADLQDPPELIPTLLKEWESGYDDVYAVRTSRQGEGCLKRATAHLYYRILKKLSPIPIQQDTGDFRLLDRRCVLALRRLSPALCRLCGYLFILSVCSPAGPGMSAPGLAGRNHSAYAPGRRSHPISFWNAIFVSGNLG